MEIWSLHSGQNRVTILYLGYWNGGRRRKEEPNARRGGGRGGRGRGFREEAGGDVKILLLGGAPQTLPSSLPLWVTGRGALRPEDSS